MEGKLFSIYEDGYYGGSDNPLKIIFCNLLLYIKHATNFYQYNAGCSKSFFSFSINNEVVSYYDFTHFLLHFAFTMHSPA